MHRVLMILAVRVDLAAFVTWRVARNVSGVTRFMRGACAVFSCSRLVIIADLVVW